MTKIMLVEDDKSLREIYGVRLLAEGYDIVSASDGEEALAMAIKERPALIVTDLMMPKISGFDMLDILRSTTETRSIKVIVMTALGSDEQRQRGDQLGADRYLVKSQVGIEDVVRAVHEVLGDQTTSSSAAATPVATQPAMPATTRLATQAPTSAATPPSIPTPGPQPSTQRTMAVPPQNNPPASTHTAPPTSPPPPSASSPSPPSGHNRIIQPINDPASRVDINELLDRELAKEAGVDLDNRPVVPSTQQEKTIIQNQLQQFSAQPPSRANALPPQNTTEQETSTPPKMPTIQIDSEGRVSMPPVNPPQVPPQNNPPAAPPTPPPPIR